MYQRGISFRLNAFITSVAIFIIAVIVFIVYQFSNKMLIQKIEEGATHQSNLIISRIDRVTVGTEEITKNMSYQALYYYKNGDIEHFLSQVLSSNSILEGIHVELFDAGKHFKHYFQATRDRTGKVVCEAKHTKESQLPGSFGADAGIWSDPFYVQTERKQLMASYSLPIYRNERKELAGIISCQISLNQLNRMLSSMKVGEMGYTFIIDKNGNFLTHPKNEWILKKNLFEKPSIMFNNGVNEIEAKIKSGRGGIGTGISLYLNNQKSWFYFARLTDSNWAVVIVIPEKELFNGIEVIFRKIALVSGIGILILFLANLLIFRKLLDPLVRITEAIQLFSFGKKEPGKSKDEIKMLVESFENWQKKYGGLINEQAKAASASLKFEKDLKSAKEVQQNIIPLGYPAFPEHPEIDLYAELKQAETIGGDLYDYFFIDSNHLLIAIGDVSGKGISASLFMAIASTLIKNKAKVVSSKEIVSRVNQELGDRNANQYFLTLFVGVLDIKTGMMDYCNAAHNFPYILHRHGGIRTLSKSHGLPLGINKSKKYKSSSVQLNFGDTIFFYTDGVINSRDLNGIHFGTQRLENTILSLNNLNSKEAVSRLMKSIAAYEGVNHQSDDITTMVLRFLYETENQA